MMIVKMIGAILIFISCGSVGFKIAANCKKEEKYLCDFILSIEYMISELQYRLTPLPQLCKQASIKFDNCLGNIYEKIFYELELQQCSDPSFCFASVLENEKSIPPITRTQMELLGKTVGQFDIDGQVKGLETVKAECERQLSLIRDNQENRLRGYKTLGLCAGAALAILFV